MMIMISNTFMKEADPTQENGEKEIITTNFPKAGIIKCELANIHLPGEVNVAPGLVNVQSFAGETGVFSPGRSPGRWYMKVVHCPNFIAYPLLTVRTRSKGI